MTNESQPLDTTSAAHASTVGRGRYSQIARAVGCTPQHVSRVMRGITNPSMETLRGIAAAAGVSVDMLVWQIQLAKDARAERKSNASG